MTSTGEYGFEDAARRVGRADLGLGEQLGRGGQGTVYRVTSLAGLVYKEYRPEVLPDLDAAALAAMVDLRAGARALSAEAQWLGETSAWPTAVVENAGSACGFLMPEVPDRFRFDYRGLRSAAERRLANFEYLLNADAYVAGVGIAVSDRDRIALLHDLAATLVRLHRMGIAVGDLSPKNLLFTTSPRAECHLIDCDAMRLDGASVLPQAETPDWQLPAAEERATAAGDAYKFALLAIRLFARSQTTTDPSELTLISPALGALARQGLDPNPALRPSPAQWAEELAPVLAVASTETAQLTNFAAGLPPWYSPGSSGIPGAPVGTATGMTTATANPKNGGIIAAAVSAAVLILIVVLALSNSHQAAPTPGPVYSSDSYDPNTTYTDPYTDPVTTTEAPTQDPEAAATVGSCFYDDGSGTTSDLVATDCATGAFEVVKIVNGSTDLTGCDGVSDEDEAVSAPSDDLVLCLSYQNDGGTAYHATQGQCVYGQSGSGSEWDTEDCQTGNFKVLAVYRGTTDSGKCKSLGDYDYSEYYTETDSSLDVLLCLSMNYPDAAGDASQNECLSKSGTDSHPTFTNTGSCSNSNVYVTGRTNTYDDPSFCGNDGATWWENSDFPTLAYTVCWAYR
ncbi:MAG TPA: hypothetical protein VFN97_04155 [Actinospica sp.]|nr:hypothetical protein [Actinospica sp.]